MHPTFLRRLAAFLALATTLGLVTARAATFPPLNSPASMEAHPGKFVWADLFTPDPAAATEFYTKLFGWTATTLDYNGKSYTVFANAGRPVAGLVPRASLKSKRPARWIGYIAVTDLAATVAKVAPAGGTVRASPRDFPDRGTQVIITDNAGSPVGLLQSTSGDAADDEPRPGDWNWFELFASPSAACTFYGQVVGYDTAPDTRTERKDDFLLSSDGQPRGGVAPLPDRPDAKPGWLGVIRVANLDATLQQVPGLGGEVLLAPRPVAYESRFAIIADSTGGTLGLVEYVDNANPATRP